MHKVYKVGWCPLCDQGWVIIVKDILTSAIYLCCDECETQWENPYAISEMDCLPFNTYGRYEIATENDLNTMGWSEFLKSYYEKP